MLSIPEPAPRIRDARCGAPDDGRNLDRLWTRSQLHAAAEMDRRVQKHPQHMLARMALADHAASVSLNRIRSSVTLSFGGTAGAYYIVAALHLAYLALSFPQLLTDTQRALLVAPLEAAEMAGETAASAGEQELAA